MGLVGRGSNTRAPTHYMILSTPSKAVALIALSRRSYFENPKPPIEAFANQMSHLFQKPTLVANTMS